MQALVHEVQPRHLYECRPGPVGSLGDTVPKPRFRQSTPSMPWSYDPYWAGKRGNQLGSNVQDGYKTSYDTGFRQARTEDKKWQGNRGMKHRYGWSMFNFQPNATMEPEVAPLGDYSWRCRKMQVASTNKVTSTGRLFKVLPGPYQPTGPLRSGNYPRTTDVSGGDGGPPRQGQVVTDSFIPNPVVPGNRANAATRAGVSALGHQDVMNVDDFTSRLRV